MCSQGVFWDARFHVYIGDALIERYYAAVMAQALRPELGKAAGLRLVYTPLNGSGLVPVMTVLKRMGHTDITVVPEQEQPNGDFPTCPYPNPEILEAMQLGAEPVREAGGPTCCWPPIPTATGWAPPCCRTARRGLSPATKWACCCWITSAGPGWSCTKCRETPSPSAASFPPP